MSKPTAIAAVTAALSRLMQTRLGVDVTTLPPDRAREATAAGPQLNIYLYQVVPNAAFRSDLATHASAAGGMLNVAPLALNLHYLLTAYGADTDWEAQRVLGGAMRVLNDQPVLDRSRLKAVSVNALADSGVDGQAERVRFSHHPLSLDDVYKIWSGFSTAYRLSVAYEASVVLIDSDLPPLSARPVLTRGPTDEGPAVDLGFPPRLDAVRFPSRVSTSRGDFAPAVAEVRDTGVPDRIVLVGQNLVGPTVTVQFRPAVGGGVIERPAVMDGGDLAVDLTPERPDPAAAAGDGHVAVPWTPETPPSEEPAWHPGFYAVTVVVGVPPAVAGAGTVRLRSNALYLPVAPRLLDAPTLTAVGRDLRLELRVEPPVIAGQRVTAIVGRSSATFVANQTTGGLAIDVPRGTELPAGSRAVVRLRVDEVENVSLVEKETPDGRTVPAFDNAAGVVVP